jgi:hypothetical protein
MEGSELRLGTTRFDSKKERNLCEIYFPHNFFWLPSVRTNLASFESGARFFDFDANS